MSNTVVLWHIESETDEGNPRVRHVLSTRPATLLKLRPGVRGRVARAWPASSPRHTEVKAEVLRRRQRGPQRYCLFCHGRYAVI